MSLKVIKIVYQFSQFTLWAGIGAFAVYGIFWFYLLSAEHYSVVLAQLMEFDQDRYQWFLQQLYGSALLGGFTFALVRHHIVYLLRRRM